MTRQTTRGVERSLISFSPHFVVRRRCFWSLSRSSDPWGFVGLGGVLCNVLRSSRDT